MSGKTCLWCHKLLMPCYNDAFRHSGGGHWAMLWVRSVCLPMPIAQNGTFVAIVRAYYRTRIVYSMRMSNPLVSVAVWPPEVAETGYRFASFGTIPCYFFQFAHYGITSCCESQPQTHKLRCCNQTQSRKTRCWTLNIQRSPLNAVWYYFHFCWIPL